MAELIEIEVKDDQVQATMRKLLQRTSDLSVPMADIARHFVNVTEDAFAEETSPFGIPWLPLARSTIESRVGRMAGKRKGGYRKDGRISKGVADRAAGFKKLQDSGQLAASINSESGRDYAQVSAGKVYAAIHQFGGKAGKGHSVEVPARPYFPVDANGNLSDTTQAYILDVISDYLIA
jgi:phage virion morphogenesis protein